MNTLADIARRHNLRLIEDSAEAIGATVDGKQTGSLGRRMLVVLSDQEPRDRRRRDADNEGFRAG